MKRMVSHAIETWDDYGDIKWRTRQILGGLARSRSGNLIALAAVNVLDVLQSPTEAHKLGDESLDSLQKRFVKQLLDACDVYGLGSYRISVEDALNHLNTLSQEEFIDWAMLHKSTNAFSSLNIAEETLSTLGTPISEYYPMDRSVFASNSPSWAFKNTRKKREISALTKHLIRWCRDYDLTEIVDVGGGQGDLCESVQQVSPALRALCVDQDSRKHYLGRTRRAYTGTCSDPNLCHVISLGKSSDFLQTRLPCTRVDGLISKPFVLSVGLHTCGSFAIEHIRSVLRVGGPLALNIPCCYHMLKNTDIGISSLHAEMTNLRSYLGARHLANLRHEPWPCVTEARDRLLRKQYRYALAYLCGQSKLFNSRLYPLPLANLRNLNVSSFAEYVHNLERLRARNRLDSAPNKETVEIDQCDVNFLEDFFNKSATKSIVHTALTFRFFQSRLLGRSLEHLIHFDRVLHIMEEHGKRYDVALRKFFPASLSARNMGVLMRRKPFYGCHLLAA